MTSTTTPEDRPGFHDYSPVWEHVMAMKMVEIHLIHRDTPIRVWVSTEYSLDDQMNNVTPLGAINIATPEQPTLNFFGYFMSKWDAPGIERQTHITIPKSSILYYTEETVDDKGQIRALFQHANTGELMIIVDPEQ